MKPPFKVLRSQSAKKDIAFSADALLAFSVVILLLAAVDFAGILWREFRFLHGIGFTIAVFFGPAFFWVSFKDLIRFGWNWKFVASFVCCSAAIVFVGSKFHENLSVKPFFQ